MPKRALLLAATSLVALLGCGGESPSGASGGTTGSSASTGVGGASTSSTTGVGGASTSSTTGSGGSPREALFYQNVGMGMNAVRVGSTADGATVKSYGVDVVSWAQGPMIKNAYGDPVISRLSSGRWAMTAWTGPGDSRGPFRLLYHEGDCPKVDDAAVIALGPESGPGCIPAPNLMMSKGSQVFAAEGGNYLFLMNGGRVYLAHLADDTHPATALTTVCLRQQRAATLAELAVGQATEVLGPMEVGSLLLSDTGIARRNDGTWVLFVKGITPQMGCQGGQLCELCNRKVHRSTSADLLTWSPLEAVVDKASIPEASVGPGGEVRLYYQDFADTCAAGDLKKAARAPISMMREDASGKLSAPEHLSFPDEGFETSMNLHYATNGNPVALPDAAAFAAFEGCLGK